MKETEGKEAVGQEEEKETEDREEEEGLPALVIISSSDTESCSGCIPLVV